MVLDDSELREQLHLAEDERVQVVSDMERASVAVTDRRFIVREVERVALDLPIEEIRRVQLDVERGRPATLVVVPQAPRFAPQVISVRPDQLDPVARLVVVVGERFALLG